MRKSDQRFKIEQFLIMPALLVIRAIPASTDDTDRGQASPIPKMEGRRERGEKKKGALARRRLFPSIRLFTRPRRHIKNPRARYSPRRSLPQTRGIICER